MPNEIDDALKDLARNQMRVEPSGAPHLAEAGPELLQVARTVVRFKAALEAGNYSPGSPTVRALTEAAVEAVNKAYGAEHE